MVYIFPIVLTLLLIYQYDYGHHKRGRLAWYLFLLVYCILVAGLRYRIGGDTVVYSTNEYLRLPDLVGYWSYDFTFERFGRGYVFLNAIARSISDDFVIMQFILAIILNIIVFRFFYRNTQNIFTAILLYMLLCYLNLNTEVLRESMAIACLLLAWEYFYRYKWLKYYLFCGIAILFHPSAAFTLILPLFTLKCFHKIFSISWFSLGLAFGLYFLGILLTSKFFDLIRLIGIATMDNYADIYETSGMSDATYYNIVGKLLDILNYIIYPFTVGWILSWSINRNSDNPTRQYIRCLTIMIVVFSYIGVLSSSMIILYRFNNYMLLFFILGMSNSLFKVIEIFNQKIRLTYSMSILFIVPFVFTPINRMFKPSGRSNTAPIHRYYPYYSVLNPKLDPEREKVHYFYQHSR